MSPTFILEGVLLFIIGLIGVCGNTAAIFVFSRKRRIQRNFHALMLSLSIFDMIYIIVALLIFSLPQFFDSYLNSGTHYYILPWALPFAQIGLTGSIYFTMAITVERYFTVCHPFFHLSHGWPARRYIIPIFCFAVIYNIPKFFELRTRVPLDPTSEGFNSTIFNMTLKNEMSEDEEDLYTYGIDPTDMRLNHYYYMIYCMWLNFILMGVGPFILLITLNTLMLLKLKEMAKESEREHGSHSTRHRKPSTVPNQHHLVIPNQFSGPRPSSGALTVGTGSRQKEMILAKVSLAIVFVFIVCHSIKWIPNIYELLQVGSSDMKWPEWVETITNFSHLLTTFNSSVNFFIYFAKHYRTLIRRRNQSSLDASRMYTATTRLESNYGGSTCVLPTACGTLAIPENGNSFKNNNSESSKLLPAANNSQFKATILINGIASTQV